MSKEYQLNVAIDPERYPDLLRRFKHKVLDDGVTIKQALVQLIQQYVDGAVEVYDDLETPRPAKRKRRSRGQGRK